MAAQTNNNHPELHALASAVADVYGFPVHLLFKKVRWNGGPVWQLRVKNYRSLALAEECGYSQELPRIIDSRIIFTMLAFDYGFTNGEIAGFFVSNGCMLDHSSLVHYRRKRGPNLLNTDIYFQTQYQRTKTLWQSRQSKTA